MKSSKNVSCYIRKILIFSFSNFDQCISFSLKISFFPYYYFSDNFEYQVCPIENDGGCGTSGVHLEEGNEGTSSSDNRYYNGIKHPGLNIELMTGWSDNTNEELPLSKITIGCCEDLGYIVDYSKADPYIP